jgi:hypothetical protein
LLDTPAHAFSVNTHTHTHTYTHTHTHTHTYTHNTHTHTHASEQEVKSEAESLEKADAAIAASIYDHSNDPKVWAKATSDAAAAGVCVRAHVEVLFSVALT